MTAPPAQSRQQLHEGYMTALRHYSQNANGPRALHESVERFLSDYTAKVKDSSGHELDKSLTTLPRDRLRCLTHFTA